MLGMSLTQRPVCECVICGEEVPHLSNSQCPQAMLEALCKGMPSISCPNCNKRTVEVNASDYYECVACHTQYTTSEMVPGVKDSSKLEQEMLLDWKNDKHIAVYRLPEKGNGVIPLRQRIKEMQAICNKEKRKRRK